MARELLHTHTSRAGTTRGMLPPKMTAGLYGQGDLDVDTEVLKLCLWFCSVPELDCDVIIRTSVTH